MAKKKKGPHRYEEGPPLLARMIKKFLRKQGYTAKKHEEIGRKLFGDR